MAQFTQLSVSIAIDRIGLIRAKKKCLDPGNELSSSSEEEEIIQHTDGI